MNKLIVTSDTALHNKNTSRNPSRRRLVETICFVTNKNSDRVSKILIDVFFPHWSRTNASRKITANMAQRNNRYKCQNIMHLTYRNRALFTRFMYSFNTPSLTYILALFQSFLGAIEVERDMKPFQELTKQARTQTRHWTQKTPYDEQGTNMSGNMFGILKSCS